LAEALQQLSLKGQEKAVGYLEAVLEEVLFETKMPPRHSGPSFSTEGFYRMGKGHSLSDAGRVGDLLKPSLYLRRVPL
jgi:hypothetical protein